MSAQKAQQVLLEQIALLPEHYSNYHEDLIELLNQELKLVADGMDKSSRRQKLSAAIKSKATQMVAGEAAK